MEDYRPGTTIRAAAELTNLRPAEIDYFSRLGLINPQVADVGGRAVRIVSPDDLELLREAATLRLQERYSPRKIVALLQGPKGKGARVLELTEKELSFLRQRNGGAVAPTLSQIASKLGISRQAVHSMERRINNKLQLAALADARRRVHPVRRRR